MGSFPFDREFLPVVKKGDLVVFLPLTAKADGTQPFGGQIYRVLQSEPIRPFIIDFLQIPGALTGGATSVPSQGSTTPLSVQTTRQLFGVEATIFAQYRVELLDDFLLQLAAPGAKNFFGAIAYGVTSIGKRLPQHHANVLLTGAGSISTDTLVWANTTSNLLSASLTSQQPKRKSRIIGIAISTTAATTVFFGDASVGGGNVSSNGSGAPVSTTVFSIPFNTADFIFLGRDSIPEEYVFENGIVVSQSNSASSTVVTVVVEEDSAGLFGGNLLDIRRANQNQSHEFYVYEGLVPNMQAFNPLNITVSTMRAMFGGFMFDVEKTNEVDDGSRRDVVGIPLYTIPRLGRVSY